VRLHVVSSKYTWRFGYPQRPTALPGAVLPSTLQDMRVYIFQRLRRGA